MGKSVKEVKVGDIFETKEGGSVSVVSIKSNKEILIEHNDDNKHQAVVEKARLFIGNIKNPYHRSVCGTGYLGFGEYKAQKDKIICIAYKVWVAMLKRCYGNEPSKRVAYKDCSVHPDWHNFQVFAGWYYSQKGWNKGFQLDKDLFSVDVKIYSEDTCCLIPYEINYSIISITTKGRVLGYYKRRDGLYEVRYKGLKGTYKSFNNKKDAVEYHTQLKKSRI